MLEWLDNLIGKVFSQRRAFCDGGASGEIDNPSQLWAELSRGMSWPTWQDSALFALQTAVAMVLFFWLVNKFEKWITKGENEMKMTKWSALALAVVLVGGGIGGAVYRGVDMMIRRAVVTEQGKLSGEPVWMGKPVSYVDEKINVVSDAQLGFRPDGVVVWRAIAPAAEKKGGK